MTSQSAAASSASAPPLEPIQTASPPDSRQTSPRQPTLPSQTGASLPPSPDLHPLVDQLQAVSLADEDITRALTPYTAHDVPAQAYQPVLPPFSSAPVTPASQHGKGFQSAISPTHYYATDPLAQHYGYPQQYQSFPPVYPPTSASLPGFGAHAPFPSYHPAQYPVQPQAPAHYFPRHGAQPPFHPHSQQQAFDSAQYDPYGAHPPSGPLVYPSSGQNSRPPKRNTIRKQLDEGKKLQSRGVVKFFDPSRGFGFIIDQHAAELGGADVFVHYSRINQPNGFRCLAPGEPVEYTLVSYQPGRYEAFGCTGPDGAAVVGLKHPQQAEIVRRGSDSSGDEGSNGGRKRRSPVRGSLQSSPVVQ
ncbi:hypothetical protein JCM10213_004693 [Rhodosporidiobolus nylandii]